MSNKTGVTCMKRYSSEELETKISAFLNKKFEQYPDIATSRQHAPVFTKPSFPARMVHSLTSSTMLPLR
jgi:hypothetical protein